LKSTQSWTLMNSNSKDASIELTPVVIATGNEHKFKEFEQLLRGVIEPIPQRQFGVPEPEETGQTFLENALLKARHTAKVCGRAALADDSGLVVPALGGAPGIYSARFAGVGATDADNRAKLLSLMDGVEQRGAYFHASIVYVRSADDPDPIIAQGRWFGDIARSEQGDQGFGYDPIFVDRVLGQHAAELSDSEKNARSHRGQAIQMFLTQWRILESV